MISLPLWSTMTTWYTIASVCALLLLHYTDGQGVCRLPPNNGPTKTYDRLLWNEQRSASTSTTPPIAAPNTQLPIAVSTTRYTSTGCWLISPSCFHVFYHKMWRIPVFTAHKVKMGKHRRRMRFRKDVRLTNEDASTINDYSTNNQNSVGRSIYGTIEVDKGHFVPASDLAGDCYINTFIFSNIALQPHDFNQNCGGDSVSKWKLAEYFQQTLSKSYPTYVITGPLDINGKYKLNNRVQIPMKYFKVIMWCKKTELRVSYCQFDTKNIMGDTKITDEEIEKITGLTFDIQPSTVCGPTTKTRKLIQCTFPESYRQHTNKPNANGNCISTTHFKLKETLQNSLKLWNSYNATSQIVQEQDTTCKKVKAVLNRLAREKRIIFAASKSDVAPLSWFVPEEKRVKMFDFLPLPSGIDHSSPLNIPLQYIYLDCDIGEIQLQSQQLSSFEIVPSIITVTETHLLIKVNFKTAELTHLETKGKWLLGNLNVDMSIEYHRNNPQLQIQGKPISTHTKVDLHSMIKKLTGSSINLPLPSFVIRDISLMGTVDLFNGGSITIVLGASIGTHRVHIVFQKPYSDSKYYAAVALDLASFRLSTLLQKTLHVDISNLPFFSSLVIPKMGVILSNGYIDAPLFPTKLPVHSLLQLKREEIYKGLWTSMLLQFKSGQKIPVILTKLKDAIDFKIVDKYKLSLKTLIDSIPGVNFNSIPLPPGITNLLNTALTKIKILADTGELLVKLDLPDQLKYFNNKLIIYKPSVTIIICFKAPRKIDVIVTGDIRLGGKNYFMSIFKKGGKYILEAAINKISFKALAKSFSADSVPRFMMSILKRFMDFEIHNAMIAFPFSTKPLQIHLSGTPVISGYKTVTIYLLIVKTNFKMHIIQGYEFNNVNLMKMVKGFTGVKLPNIGILNQNFDIPVVIAPLNRLKAQFYQKVLKGVSIVKGVSLTLDMGWPSSCSSDILCKVLSMLFGPNLKFKVKGVFRGPNMNSLAASLPDIKLGGGMILKGLGLMVKMGKQTTVGVKGTLILKSQGLSLYAEMSQHLTGVRLLARMDGCWRNAFKIKWLSVCHLRLVVGVSYTPPFISALEFGGQFHIGNHQCTSNPIIATGYFGIDRLDPRNNYYYVSVNSELTFHSFLKALCIKVRLPSPIGDSGFPKGFLASFSLMGVQLPKVTISAGYRFKGGFRVFGLEAYADITINSRGMKANISLPVMNIAKGLLKMAATPKFAKGPYLITAISHGKIAVEAKVYISVLGISVYGSLKITQSKYECTIEGKMLKIFEVRLQIFASYKSIKSANFRVHGYFKSDLFSKICNVVQSYLKKASSKVTTKINAAQNNLRSKERAFHNAANKVARARNYVRSKQALFDKAVKKVNYLKRRVNNICHIRHCRRYRVCAPCGFSGSYCARKAFRRCILRLPRVKHCCRSISNPACVAKNAACYILKEPIKATLSAAAKAVHHSRRVLHHALAVLQTVEVVVRNSRHLLTIARGALNVVKGISKAVLKYVNKVISISTINIQEISFHTSLEVASKGSFGVRVKARIAGKSMSFSVDFKMSNPVELFKAVANKLVSGLTKFIGL